MTGGRVVDDVKRIFDDVGEVAERLQADRFAESVQPLAFGEAEARNRGADFLDDVDLVGASFLEDHVERGLLFGGRSSGGRTRGSGASSGDRRKS